MKKIINYNLNTKTIDNNKIEKCDCIKLIIELEKDMDYSNCNFRLLAEKQDKTRIEFKNFVFKDNKIIAEELDKQFSSCTGIVNLELVIEEDNCQITSNNFYFYVSDTINNNIIKSIDDVETLKNLENYITEAEKSIEIIKSELENISLEKLIEIKRLLEIENSKANENIEILNFKNELALENISLLEAKNLIASSNINSLDNKNLEAINNIDILNSKNSESEINISNLDTCNIQAVQNKEYLDDSIASANAIKINLDSSINIASSNINSLDSKNSSATSNINSLDTKINLAVNKKVELDNSINRANTIKSELDISVTRANEKIEEFEEILNNNILDFGTF